MIRIHSKEERVNYKDFLADLKGVLNENRQKSIIQAYNRASKVIGGPTTLEELGRIYDSKRHPEVLTKKKDAEEAFN